MKNRKIKLFLWVLLVSTLFSCNDWQKDPTEILTVIDSENDPKGILLSSNYPKNVSTIIFQKNKKYFVGTTDGKIFRSEDLGKTWTLVCNTAENARVNFIAGQTINATYTVINFNFLIAGTNRGGYYSEDEGKSWKQVLPSFDAQGNPYIITGGEVMYLPSNGCTIYFTGLCGANNYFQSSGKFETWYSYLRYKYFHYAMDAFSNNSSMTYSYEVGGRYYSEVVTINCSGYNSDTKSMILTTVIPGVTKNIYFDENMELSGNIIMQFQDKTSKIYVGSKKGILISVDKGATWEAKLLKDKKVYSIIPNTVYGGYFAAVSDGLYCMEKGDSNFVKINLFQNTTSITYLKIYNDYLYLVTGEGNTYYCRLSPIIVNFILIPVLHLPDNRAICNSSPVLQWGLTDKINNVNYNLQISENKDFSSVVADTIITDNKFVTNLTKKNEPYYWRLRSYKLGNYSKWSEIREFSIK